MGYVLIGHWAQAYIWLTLSIIIIFSIGQLIDHDVTQTATTRGKDGQSIQCCGQEFDQNPSLLHPACLPIKLPQNDPFYARHSQTCMSFVRSGTAPRQDCNFGPREQLNQLSSYIDGGMVYGTSTDQASKLREFSGGRMATSKVDGADFLPQKEGGCGIPKEKQLKCFSAGDGRVNVQADLVVLQAIWLKQHNLVADELQRINPSWDDETVYQEAKRIIGAQIQVSTDR